MNYILLMTEGTCEQEFLNILLERDLLKFNQDDLLMDKIYHARQIEGEILGFIQALSPNNGVIIYRVGDKMKDKLKIPSQLMKEKIKNEIKICTLPEFEILLILNENLYDEYLKSKSSLKPSEYYKNKNKSFNKTRKFVNDYFSSLSNKEIIDLINLYVLKRSHSHKKDELTLKEILKID